ncbi:MAG: beta strand repeat-containing protein, partial [Candidatus Methylomirabilales bacterium]
VQLTSGNINGSGGTLTSSTTFDMQSGSVSAILGGAVGLNKTTAGTVTLSGANTYTGVTTINGGTLSISADANLGTAPGAPTAGQLAFEGGTLETSATFTLNANRGTALNAGGGTIQTDPTTTLTYNGVMAGAAGNAFTKTGTGTLVLGGTNTYAGVTTVSAGILNVQNNTALGTTAGGTTVASGATLEIASGIAIGAETLNVGGAGVGSNGALVVTSGSGSLAGAVTLGANASIGGNGSLTLSGTVDDIAAGTSTLTQVGSGTLTFSSTVGATNALAAVTTSSGQTTAINGGSVRTTGAQTYGGIVTSGGATTLTSTGGGNITANNSGNDFNGDLILSTSGSASIVDSNALALGASSVGTLTAQTLAGNLTLNGVITASGSGDSIVLASAGNFVNNAGAGALNPGAGRWLVWSTDPALDTRGGLVYNFKQYNATYGVTTVLGSNNGFLYTIAPTITPSLIGSTSKVYDGTTTATLTGANYATSAAIDGDTVALNNPATGTYDTRDVGAGKTVTASGLTVSATNGAATVYGYTLTSTSASAAIGTITQLDTNVSGTRTYDATNTAAGADLTTISALIAGDVVSVTGAGTVANKNVGVNKAVTNGGLALGGADGGNYNLLAGGNTLTITQLDTNVSGTRTYDATNTAAGADLTTISALIAGDVVSVTG